MEFVVITLLLIVVILQIVILANQQKNGKLVRDFTTFKPKTQQPDQNRERFRDRKDNNFRNNRKNQQDFRQKQPAAVAAPSAPASGAVENVEKSLRDINLKLKNAERDQEVARRRIQENIGKDGPRQRHQQDGNRGGRDGNRDHRRDRDRPSRNNWRGRNNQDRSADASQNNEPLNHPAIESTAVEETRQPSFSIEPTVSLPDLNPVDFDAEMEHGRKVQVKRRLLKEDLPGTSQDDTADATSSDNAPPVANGNFESTESDGQTETSNGEISFGRR